MASLVLVHHFIDTLTLVNLSSLYDPLHVHRALILRRLFEWQKMATGHPVVASSLTKQFGSLEQVCSSVKQVFGAPCTKPWRLTCYRSRRNRPATATSLRTTPPILRRWLAPPGPRPLSPTAISRYSIIHSFEKKNWIRCCVAKIQLNLIFLKKFLTQPNGSAGKESNVLWNGSFNLLHQQQSAHPQQPHPAYGPPLQPLQTVRDDENQSVRSDNSLSLRSRKGGSTPAGVNGKGRGHVSHRSHR